MQIYNSQEELLDRVDELEAWAYLTIPKDMYEEYKDNNTFLTPTQVNMGEAKDKDGNHIIFIQEEKSYENRRTSNTSK